VFRFLIRTFYPRDLAFNHSFPILVYLSALFFAVTTLSHPVYLGLIAFFLFAGLCLHPEGFSRWVKYFSFVAQLSVFFVIISIVFCNEGHTLLWKCSFPNRRFGFDLSLEEIFFSVTMCMQMILSFTCICLYVLLCRNSAPDSLFNWMPKTRFTFTLASNLLFQLGFRLQGAEEALKARGVELNRGKILQRLKTRTLLLKTVLMHALENSWQTAEALEARAFGNPKKTFYFKTSFRLGDWFLLISGILLWFWLIFHWFSGEGHVMFFPATGSLTKSFHLVSFASFAFLLFCFLWLLMWRRKYESF